MIDKGLVINYGEGKSRVFSQFAICEIVYDRLNQKKSITLYDPC